MKSGPLISVIVANYNNGNYIRDCLDSILNQTYKDIEIIVADDCSTDNSQEIVKEYEKKYPGVIKCIFSPINIGVARTRHEAILQARGEYITTLDSDDYYCNLEKLEKEMGLVLYFKEKKSRDIIAFSNIVLVREDKTIICKQGDTEPIKEGIILDEIITRACMIPRDFVMRKTAYHEIAGYDLSIPIYEDWDLKTRLAAKYEFYYSGISGTAYRRHGAGLSSVPIPIHIKWLKKIFKKNIKLVDQYKKKDIIQAFNQFVKSMRNHYFNNCLKKELELNLHQRKMGNVLKLCFKIIYYALNQFKFKCLLRLFSRNKIL
jgi:glycosyltransferase involved in cell wall biosynthesis